jgi:hypothetical protein
LGDWHNLSTGFQGCPIAQGLCVVLDVRQNMRDVGRFLCSHSAVLVEIEWLVTHQARGIDALTVSQIDRVDGNPLHR